MTPDELLRLISDDDMGLLDVKPAAPPSITADERLLRSFREIEDFFRVNGRKPEANAADMNEFRLHSRLEGINSSTEKANSLLAVDECGLISPPKPLESVADIFADDCDGLLDADPAGIFTLRNIPTQIAKPDHVAQRKKCPDFDTFGGLFDLCQKEISAGIREMRSFTGEQQIQEGHFFVLHGVLAYVAEVGERERKNKKVNARLRLIFENGTESNMLLRSLSTELYKDPAGRRVLDHHDRELEELSFINEDDQATGFIYVLKSLSQRQEILQIEHLYKIGYSTTPVEDRIKNAAKEPTYLMAPVKVVSVFQAYNLNPQKFELFIHTFFGSSCLDVSVPDPNGQVHRPREWFVAPLEAIDLAVKLLVNGEIVNYRYDPDSKSVQEKVSKLDTA